MIRSAASQQRFAKAGGGGVGAAQAELESRIKALREESDAASDAASAVETAAAAEVGHGKNTCNSSAVTVYAYFLLLLGLFDASCHSSCHGRVCCFYHLYAYSRTR